MSEPAVADGYEQRYGERLWSLLPAFYRAADSEIVDGTGPLRELLDRVGASMAVVRRSIDRLWEDQFIESCDSWVIPYLAELLATNLVPSMDARAQRLDVAHTIYYRRRKGTVALLEQLAHDVTGYQIHVVEFFRRLARNRHDLDPAIGRPADTAEPAQALALQRLERLTGPLTGTPAGGWADLRHPLGASLTGTAYDEFHHRVDVRRGRGELGWYDIAKVGFFLCRSAPIAVDHATPVAVAGCPGHFSFDPTGRQIALFAASGRGADDADVYGENWEPLASWQLPLPITAQLWAAITAQQAPPGDQPPGPGAYPDPNATLWPGSVAVRPAGSNEPLTLSTVRVWPEVGRFALGAGAPPDVTVSYQYGLFSYIGAGPYDRRVIGAPQSVDPQPVIGIDGGSATALPDALTAAGTHGTVAVRNGLTLSGVAPVGSAAAPVDAVTLRGADSKRAVIRVGAGSPPWTFTGASTATSTLRLEGLLVSGTDLILRGGFAEVVVSCCTFDPGGSGDLRTPPAVYATGVDGAELRPVTVWVEGSVSSLIVERSIVGPIRSRTGGLVEQLTVTDSIVQGLPSEQAGSLVALRDADAVFSTLAHPKDALTSWLSGQLAPDTAAAVTAHADRTDVPAADAALLVADLQTVIDGPLIWTAQRFADRPLRDSTAARVLDPPPAGADLAALNRQLLAEAFPLGLADAAIALDAGAVNLSRTTVLGSAYLHALQCSESILDDVVRVRDAQAGCLRFSAWTTDSALPRRYESVQIAPRAPIMVSRRYGEWGYAQLHDDADTAIQAGNTGGTPSLLTGSHDDSAMGVFCRDGAAIRDRSLLIKLQEYLPIGLSPVLVHLPVPDPACENMRGRPWPPT